MILSRRAALNGVQLDEIDPWIVIRGVDTGVPHESISAVNRMGGFGQRVTGKHWESLDVSITWAMDIPRTNLPLRRQIYEAVTAWALQKGWLTVKYMAGRRMWVDHVVLPSGGDLWRWTDEFTITFRAYGVPFWQGDTKVSASGGSITVPGNLPTVCDAEITNATGSTINSLTVKVGQSQMTFAGLVLANGERLVIGHDNGGLLYIRIYTSATAFRSAYDKRTGGSADDLTVEPGAQAITVSAGTYSISCFGRYA